MKVLLLTVAIAAVTASALPEPSNYDYHRRFGIPNALTMQESENSISEDVSRIVGGSQTPPGILPYAGGIIISLTNGMTSICSCCLITNSRSLTAAHCWWDGTNQARLFNLIYGSVALFSGGIRVPSSDVTTHPNWDPDTNQNDIAVISHSHIAYTNNIRNIALPAGAELSSAFVGFTGIASGFGKTLDSQPPVSSNAMLYHVSVQVISNSVCQAVYGTVVQSGSMCSGASNRGICGGDSGGPLVVSSNNRYILVGVTSMQSRYCQAGYPSGYTRVTSHISWIWTRL